MSIKDETARKRLIMMVRERRQLWDPKDPRYKDPRDTQKSWIEIGYLCRNTPERCQRTWKYLRDCYQAKRKRQPSSTEYGRKESWAFMDIMRFIDDVSKQRPKPTVNIDSFLLGKLETESTALESNTMQENLEADPHSNIIEIVDDDMPPTCSGFSNTGSFTPPPQEDPLVLNAVNEKRKGENPHENFRKAILREMRKGKDPDFQWLSSLYPLLKEFKDTLTRERVKIKIHSIIVESLEEQGIGSS